MCHGAAPSKKKKIDLATPQNSQLMHRAARQWEAGENKEIAVILFLLNNTLASSCVKKDLRSSLHRTNTPAVCYNWRYWVSGSLFMFRVWNAASVFSFSSYLSAGKIFNQTQDVSKVISCHTAICKPTTILCNGCHLMLGKVTALTEGKDKFQ